MAAKDGLEAISMPNFGILGRSYLTIAEYLIKSQKVFQTTKVGHKYRHEKLEDYDKPYRFQLGLGEVIQGTSHHVALKLNLASKLLVLLLCF